MIFMYQKNFYALKAAFCFESQRQEVAELSYRYIPYLSEKAGMTYCATTSFTAYFKEKTAVYLTLKSYL